MLPVKSSTWHHITKFGNWPVLEKKKKKKKKREKRGKLAIPFLPYSVQFQQLNTLKLSVRDFGVSTIHQTDVDYMISNVFVFQCVNTHTHPCGDHAEPCFTWLLDAIIGGSCHKYHFCHNKSFVLTNTFVVTKHVFCCNKSMLVVLSWQKLCLLWQNYVCRDKHVFIMRIFVVVTSILLSQQKTCFVVTNMCLPQQTCLSWQNFCRNKNDTCGNSCQRYCTTDFPHRYIFQT